MDRCIVITGIVMVVLKTIKAMFDLDSMVFFQGDLSLVINMKGKTGVLFLFLGSFYAMIWLQFLIQIN